MRGKEIIPVSTSRDNHYKVTAEQRDHACYEAGQARKLLILDNPNNSTGAIDHEDEIGEIAEIRRAYNVIIVSGDGCACHDDGSRDEGLVCTWDLCFVRFQRQHLLPETSPILLVVAPCIGVAALRNPIE